MIITTKTSLPLPALLHVSSTQLTIRVATISDLPDVLDLLVDDHISAGRGDFSAPESRSAAFAAFAAIQADPRNEVIVLEREGQVVATMQLTIIPGLSRGGATRLQIEAVHVASGAQSSGFGSAMMRWVIDEAAPALGVAFIQLTSDAQRVDAHRFYKRLGFVDSHIGFKFSLNRHGEVRPSLPGE